jgi:hypothetical protein
VDNLDTPMTENPSPDVASLPDLYIPFGAKELRPFREIRKGTDIYIARIRDVDIWVDDSAFPHHAQSIFIVYLPEFESQRAGHML